MDGISDISGLCCLALLIPDTKLYSLFTQNSLLCVYIVLFHKKTTGQVKNIYDSFAVDRPL